MPSLLKDSEIPSHDMLVGGRESRESSLVEPLRGFQRHFRDISETFERDAECAADGPRGFPCQPFSALGAQPGLGDPGGDGWLFRQVVRVLQVSKSPLFLLENVPGLAQCDDGRALQTIKRELSEAGGGYDVFLKTVNARHMTAQSRKRIFFLGFRRDVSDVARKKKGSEGSEGFEMLALVDLQLRAQEIFETEEDLEAKGLLEHLTISKEQFRKLQDCKKWSRRGGMTDTLAWGDKAGRQTL